MGHALSARLSCATRSGAAGELAATSSEREVIGKQTSAWGELRRNLGFGSFAALKRIGHPHGRHPSRNCPLDADRGIFKYKAFVGRHAKPGRANQKDIGRRL